MKKKRFFVFYAVLLLMVNILPAQGNGAYDTVRYGDPWYAFNPVNSILPPDYLCRQSGNSHCYLYDGTCAPLLFGNICGYDRTYFSGRQEFQAYANNNYTVYGIALTAQAIPDSEMVPELLLVHGIFYHSVGLPGGSMTENATDPSYIHVDSIGKIDTLNMWQAPMRRCYFDYHFDYDFSTNTPGKDSVFTSNCYEFFFDSPVSMKSNGKNAVDTFFIGGQHCSPISDSSYDGALLMCGFDSLYQQPWMMMLDSATPSYLRQGVNAFFSYLSPQIHYPGINAKMAWGVVFPIIKLRCVEPRLRLEGRGGLSATVAWRQNETPEQYQVSIGPVGNKPDSGAMFYTTDTFYTFTNLEPDTNYSVWVRKACRYTTSAYDTIVWSEWSNEIIFMAVGIDEVEADGVRITSQRGSIVVEGAEGREVRVYDMLGREVNGKGKSEKGKVTLSVPAAGIYMVRVGELPIRRVVVVR